MAKKQAATAPLRSTEPLYREIRLVLEAARSSAYRAVNTAMVQAYWHVGRLIVEHEQGGRHRAAYGEAVLEDLSRRLTADFGWGFDVTNLRKMRQFYRDVRDFETRRVSNSREAGCGKARRQCVSCCRSPQHGVFWRRSRHRCEGVVPCRALTPSPAAPSGWLPPPAAGSSPQ